MSFAAYSFGGSDEIKAKYREPYLTEALNRKLAVVLPRGLYTGFQIIEAPLIDNLKVVIAGDPDTGESVALYATKTGTVQDFSLTIRLVGQVVVDVSAYFSQKVIFAITAAYALGTTTTAAVMVYSETEFALLLPAVVAELLIIGKVDVPAAGHIPGTAISGDGRTTPWSEVARGSLAWDPLVKNGGFEISVTNENSPGSTPFWEGQPDPAGKIAWVPKDSLSHLPHSGDKSLVCVKQGLAGAITQAILSQAVFVPVVPGQHVRLQIYKKVNIPSATGTVSFGVRLVDSSGVDTVFLTADLPVSVLDAGWVKIEQTLEIPSGSYAISHVGVFFINITWGNGDALLLDDAQVWLEPVDALGTGQFLDKVIQPMAARYLLLGQMEPSSGGFAQRVAKLVYDPNNPSNEGKVQVLRRDEDPAQLPPVLELMGRLLLGQSGSLLPSDAVALLPRISARLSTAGGVERTLLLETSGPSYNTRLYGRATGAFEVTINARWDGTTWNKDLNGAYASKWVFGNGGLTQFRKLLADNVPWGDSIGVGQWSDQVASIGPLSNSLQDQTDFGLNLTDTAGEAQTPRIQPWVASNAVSQFTCLLETRAVGGGGNPRARLYVGDSGFWTITHNARWNEATSQWSKDAVLLGASALVMGGTALEYLKTLGSTAVPWGPGAWDENGLNLLGSDLMAIPGAELLAAFRQPVKDAIGVDRTLMFVFPVPTDGTGTPSTTIGAVRIYAVTFAGLYGAMEISLNARWDGANWVPDVNGFCGKLSLVVFDAGGATGATSLVLSTTPGQLVGVPFSDLVFAQAQLELRSPAGDGTSRSTTFFGGASAQFGTGATFAHCWGWRYGPTVAAQAVYGSCTWAHTLPAVPASWTYFPGFPAMIGTFFAGPLPWLAASPFGALFQAFAAGGPADCGFEVAGVAL